MACSSPRPFVLCTILPAAGLLILGGAAHASDEPESIQLTGTVRDFAERTVENGHPDFEVTPDHGFRHYAGNVAQLLDADGKPAFLGGGYRVDGQWRDENHRPIAPHLYNARYDTVPAGPVDLADPVVLDDQDGDDAIEITATSVEYNADGTSTWTYHLRELPGGRNLKYWVLKLDPSHQLRPGTTMGAEVGDHGGFYGARWSVAKSFEEGDFVVVLDGHYTAETSAEGVKAKCGKNTSTGMTSVPTMTLGGGGEQIVLVHDAGIGDSEGDVGPTDDGGIDSADRFRQWYRDVPGVNVSAPLTLTLNRQPDGTYVFDDKTDPCYEALGGFFPIDGQMLGNSGGSPDRNYHFTLELHTQFTYDADGAQIFQFAGDDDVWVYIDGKLAIDLGGVHGSTTQFVSLDRLDLVDGETYTLDFFFAERHRTQSNFRITTNIHLETSGVPSMTAAFD